ncbi:hypothetical protein Y032_0012g1620 [Ancylostoma ceylanicum]|uniref:Uncharacterized protein n=1 Tax=Ancylostoma ceylanicum TaxID=53326 RepID=A0A016VBE3_9BILA|nr:hypothetical protein Y032_0012g1620 [Ancylostoma ceylanicum]
MSATSYKSVNSLQAAFKRELSKIDIKLRWPAAVLLEGRLTACTDAEADTFEQHLDVVTVNACAKQVVNTVLQ